MRQRREVDRREALADDEGDEREGLYAEEPEEAPIRPRHTLRELTLEEPVQQARVSLEATG